MNTDIDAQKIERNIQQTVAVSALKKIHQFVDQSVAEEAAARTFSKWFLIAFGIVLLGFVMALKFFNSATTARTSSTPAGHLEQAKPLKSPSATFPDKGDARRVGPETDRNETSELRLYTSAVSTQIEAYRRKHFPATISQKQLRGSLQFTITINPDGQLESALISKSSGQPILDEQALATIKGASPFPPFSQTMKKNIDILELTRTINFAP